MVLVYNRAPHDIVVRYAPNGSHQLSPNQSITLNLPPNTEVFATKDRDQSTAYARLLVRPDSTTLFFSDTGGGYGAGQEVKSQAQPQSELSFWAPKSLAGDERQPPPAQFMPANEINRGAPLSQPNDAPAAEQTGGLSGGPGGMIEVPGMGWMDAASIPPHVLAQLQQQKQQQQQPQQMPMQAPAPPAQYRKPAMDKYSWLLPLGILALLVLALLWTFYGKKFFRM